MEAVYDEITVQALGRVRILGRRHTPKSKPRGRVRRRLPRSIDYTGIYVVIPAYMAAKYLDKVVAGVQRIIPGRQVIVVDDGSGDNTAMVARKYRVRVYRRQSNHGKGAALDFGIQRALEQPDCRAIVTMDADQQHDPASLERFIRRFNRSGADLIIGKRERTPGTMPWIRILANSVTSFLLSLRSGISIRDSQCGYRLIRRAVLEQIPIHYTGAQAETEILLMAALQGYQIKYIPIPTIYSGQKSYVHPLRDIADFLKIYATSFLCFMR